MRRYRIAYHFDPSLFDLDDVAGLQMSFLYLLPIYLNTTRGFGWNDLKGTFLKYDSECHRQDIRFTKLDVGRRVRSKT